MSEIFFINAAVIAGLMTAVWLLSLPLRDASIVDPVWGLGFVVVGWVTYFAVDEVNRRLLPTVLVTVWGLRLSGYLTSRNFGKPEDYRYREMREKWGRWFPLLSLVTVFLLQGAIMWIVSLPLQTAHQPAADKLWLQLLGTAVWAVGIFFETVGDWQLARFKQNPENSGQVMDRGLWRYTRHPNYFGDFCVWWGMSLVAVGCGAPWWSIIGPVVMSIFLMRISGVTLLEKSLVDKKPGYAAYAARTNAFFPWLPR